VLRPAPGKHNDNVKSGAQGNFWWGRMLILSIRNLERDALTVVLSQWEVENHIELFDMQERY
jgi:hypothetical protein